MFDANMLNVGNLRRVNSIKPIKIWLTVNWLIHILLRNSISSFITHYTLHKISISSPNCLLLILPSTETQLYVYSTDNSSSSTDQQPWILSHQSLRQSSPLSAATTTGGGNRRFHFRALNLRLIYVLLLLLWCWQFDRSWAVKVEKTIGEMRNWSELCGWTEPFQALPMLLSGRCLHAPTTCAVISTRPLIPVAMMVPDWSPSWSANWFVNSASIRLCDGRIT